MKEVGFKPVVKENLTFTNCCTLGLLYPPTFPIRPKLGVRQCIRDMLYHAKFSPLSAYTVAPAGRKIANLTNLAIFIGAPV